MSDLAGYPCEGAEMGVCGGGPTHDEACPSSEVTS